MSEPDSGGPEQEDEQDAQKAATPELLATVVIHAPRRQVFLEAPGSEVAQASSVTGDEPVEADVEMGLWYVLRAGRSTKNFEITLNISEAMKSDFRLAAFVPGTTDKYIRDKTRVRLKGETSKLQDGIIACFAAYHKDGDPPEVQTVEVEPEPAQEPANRLEVKPKQHAEDKGLSTPAKLALVIGPAAATTATAFFLLSKKRAQSEEERNRMIDDLDEDNSWEEDEEDLF